MPTELRVNRSNLREAEIAERDRAPLEDGEIRLAIDKFAISANNVTYAVVGDLIGYWKFYPAPDPYGLVPVWGFADVVESRSADVPVGERVYGFLPMAEEVVVRPERVKHGWFDDGAPHRKELPPLYNRYMRASAEPASLKAMEDARCALFPLFATSYCLYDWLCDNDFFGAEQILIGSASSKTGFGLGKLLAAHDGAKPRLVGLTSARNKDFVESLGCWDDVLAYDEVSKIDPGRKTGFVDMAGSGDLIREIHERVKDNVVVSSIVGATHWEAPRGAGDVPGARPTMFFAPAQMAKREKEWGPGEMMRRAGEAWMRLADEMGGVLDFERFEGGAAVKAAWLKAVDGDVSPRVAMVASVR